MCDLCQNTQVMVFTMPIGIQYHPCPCCNPPKEKGKEAREGNEHDRLYGIR